MARPSALRFCPPVVAAALYGSEISQYSTMPDMITLRTHMTR